MNRIYSRTARWKVVLTSALRQILWILVRTTQRCSKENPQCMHRLLSECVVPHKLSRVMRKLAYAFAANKHADPCAHPRIQISVFVTRCPDSIISPVFCIRNFKVEVNCSNRAGRCESKRVGNPENMFSRDEALMQTVMVPVKLPICTVSLLEAERFVCLYWRFTSPSTIFRS